jgi:hypothetical protein
MTLLSVEGIKQAKSYIREHLTQSRHVGEELEFIIELCPQRNDLVRARFASRHSNNKNYAAIIQFKNDIEQPIQGWYCTCISGWRDVGCCAHVTALIWHLGVCRAKVEQDIHPLSAGKLLAAVDDSMQFSDVDDTDDEENDDDSLKSSDADSTTDSDTSTDDDDDVSD